MVVVGIVPLTLATCVDEAERDDTILLLLLNAAVDDAPNEMAANTAPGKNLIVMLSREKGFCLQRAVGLLLFSWYGISVFVGSPPTLG